MRAGQTKLLSIIVGLAVLIATPALASKTPKKKVSAPKVHASQTHRAYDANAIYEWDGGYRGTDPDPNIRFQLLRDQNMPND